MDDISKIRQCPMCKKEIDKEAKICPYCRTDLTVGGNISTILMYVGGAMLFIGIAITLFFKCGI